MPRLILSLIATRHYPITVNAGDGATIWTGYSASYLRFGILSAPCAHYLDHCTESAIIPPRHNTNRAIQPSNKETGRLDAMYKGTRSEETGTDRDTPNQRRFKRHPFP